MATRKKTAFKKAVAKPVVSKAPPDEPAEEAPKEAKKSKKDEPESALQLVMRLEKEQKFGHIELKQRKAEDFLSTGVLSLDLILGGGYFGGRIISFAGQPHSAKSTLGYTSAGCLHKRGVLTQVYDYEGTTELAYAKRLGMVFDERNPLIRYYKPAHGHQGYAMMLELLKQLPDANGGPPQVAFVIDTIAAMPTEAEMEDWEGNKRMAARATMHSEWMGRLKTLISRKNVAVIALNQVRSGMDKYKPESFPGGNAWAFAIDVFVKTRSKPPFEVDGEGYSMITFKTVKNKWFIPGQEAEVALHLGHGFDPASDVTQFLKLTGLLSYARVGRSHVPVVQGLDEYADGEKVDQQYKSSPAFEALIRKQAASSEPVIVAACRKLLTSGKATELFISQKKEKPPGDPDEVLGSLKRPKGKSAMDTTFSTEDEGGALQAQFSEDEPDLKEASNG